MRGIISTVMAAALSLAVLGASANLATAEDVSLIGKEELKSMLGNPDVIVVDVRSDRQWSESDWKIPGALHENPRHSKSWAKDYPKDKTLVIY